MVSPLFCRSLRDAISSRIWERSRQARAGPLARAQELRDCLVALAKRSYVLQRIAVDEEKVRQRALLDNSELARISIARAGKRQQFAIGRRRHDQRFRWRKPAREVHDTLALTLKGYLEDRRPSQPPGQFPFVQQTTRLISTRKTIPPSRRTVSRHCHRA
jgi:hypothetical protein